MDCFAVGLAHRGYLRHWHSTVKHALMTCHRQQQPTPNRPAIALGNSLGNSPRSSMFTVNDIIGPLERTMASELAMQDGCPGYPYRKDDHDRH